MPKIANIHAHKVLNSRGNWTINTTVELDSGAKGTGEIPEGASKGGYEAVSISPDKAVELINSKLGPNFCGFDAEDQKALDHRLIEIDGSADKKNLGENTILSVSIATAKAMAHHLRVPLYRYLKDILNTKEVGIPTPIFNIINGGKHSRNNLSFQEFMAIPARKHDYLKALEIGADVYQSLKKVLLEKGFDIEVGDEGGFAPEGLSTFKALDLISEAVNKSGLNLGDDVFLGMDVASNSFYQSGKYELKEESKSLSSKELQVYYEELLPKYPIIYTEDVFIEDDLWSWSHYYEKFNETLLVTGDDLTVTNTKRLKVAIDNKACNAVIVKPNQIGTLTETYEFVKKAKEAGMYTIVSHRSGEAVIDTFIADFAVAVNADYLKAGAPAHERVAKYNKLLQIYGELNNLTGYCVVK